MEENEKIKLLLVGDITWPMYVNAFYYAAKDMDDVEAELMDCGKLNTLEWETYPKWSWRMFYKAEYKFSIGPDVAALDRRLLSLVKRKKFDAVFLYSARNVGWRTLKKLRDMGVIVAMYCNDDPFSDYYPSYFWRNIIKGARYSDITYSFRLNNIEQYRSAGAERVKLLRAYYNEDRSYRIEGENPLPFHVPKVIFLGHTENDERMEYLDALVERGIKIGVRETPEWMRFAEGKDVTVFHETVKQYNAIINAAEIAIVFLSKLNHDTYTRRCFEIPITGTMMLAPYNDDLASLFREGEEIVFYRSKEDFVAKVEYYLVHSEERRRIGENGRKRLLKDGHGAKDRMRQVIDDLKEVMAKSER